MPLLSRRSLLTAALVLAAAPGVGCADARGEMGAFRIPGPGLGFKVHYYVPETAGPDAEILFVLHGRNRDPETYRAAWAPAARAAGVILIAPEFDAVRFEGSRLYNLGGMQDADGRWLPRSAWTFNYIEAAFDAFLARSGRRAPGYALYGHSAGAQFVQRFTLFMPQARVIRAVAANAGWYTFPDRDIDFPYGVGDAPISDAALLAYFAKPLVVLLGDQDLDVDADGLRRTAEALAQGPHRFARGQAFFSESRRQAEKLDAPFNWELRIAHGIAHDNAAMSRVAAGLILPDVARRAA